MIRIHQCFDGVDHQVAETDVERSLKLADFFCQAGERPPVQSGCNIHVRQNVLVQGLFIDPHLFIKIIKLHLVFPPRFPIALL